MKLSQSLIDRIKEKKESLIPPRPESITSEELSSTLGFIHGKIGEISEQRIGLRLIGMHGLVSNKTNVCLSSLDETGLDLTRSFTFSPLFFSGENLSIINPNSLFRDDITFSGDIEKALGEIHELINKITS